MRGRAEFLFYVSVAVGMALATSSFTVFSGIFQVARAVPAMIAIALAGVFCAGLSLSIAELASMFPSAPGIRTYFKPAFGTNVSLYLVYLYLIFTVLMAGVEGYLFALVARTVMPVSPVLTVAAVIVSLTIVNLAGLELPRGTQMAITAVAVLLLLALPIAAIRTPAPMALEPFRGFSDFAAVPAAGGMAVFLYMGFEWATPVGLRPSSYQRKVPMALPASIGILAIVYLLFTFLATLYVPRSTLGSVPIPHVPVYLAVFGPAGKYVAFALACGASGSTFNAGIMGGARLLFMLSREAYLPAWVGRTSERSGAPVGGIIVLGASAMAAALVVISFGLQLVLAIVGAAIMSYVYGAFMLAAIVLRRKRPTASRPYRSPVPMAGQWLLVFILPALGTVALLSIPSLVNPALWWLAGTLVASVALATWSSRRALARASYRGEPMEPAQGP